MRQACLKLAHASHTGVDFWLNESLDDLEAWVDAAAEAFKGSNQ